MQKEYAIQFYKTITIYFVTFLLLASNLFIVL